MHFELGHSHAAFPETESLTRPPPLTLSATKWPTHSFTTPSPMASTPRRCLRPPPSALKSPDTHAPHWPFFGMRPERSNSCIAVGRPLDPRGMVSQCWPGGASMVAFGSPSASTCGQWRMSLRAWAVCQGCKLYFNTGRI
ncbi:hypothetical protein BCR44DRAFT_1453924 [Catenaria anguillulae PL171]|uniref:Uncharacterized protein n=1 Tax=Catenaria anguillulae PL171 TaxID=765915 RepID=A0A1Y2H3R9_9FUNG|nr:hypothetical protein BCR44DRAFT_1453924 [Catenaria anguillulae PL171]